MAMSFETARNEKDKYMSSNLSVRMGKAVHDIAKHKRNCAACC